MIIALTGHTGGIGKILHQALEERGHQVLGFSRSFQFDITDPRTTDAIIDWNPDVLINTVWTQDDPWAQYRVQDIFTRALTNKTLISFGSRATDWGIGCEYPMYDGSKEAIHKHARWLTLNSSHRVLLVRSGLVNTKKFAHRDKPKVDPNHLADFIRDWLEGPFYMEHISEVVWSPEMPGEENKFSL